MRAPKPLPEIYEGKVILTGSTDPNRKFACAFPACNLKPMNSASKVLRHHDAVHLGEKPHKCPHEIQDDEGVIIPCPYASGYKENLERHVAEYHDEASMSYACEVCGKIFYSEYERGRHAQRAHMGTNKTRPVPAVGCPRCGIVEFKNKQQRYQHKSCREQDEAEGSGSGLGILQ